MGNAEAGLTRAEVARALGVSRGTVRNMEARGELEPQVDARGVHRFAVADVERLAAERGAFPARASDDDTESGPASPVPAPRPPRRARDYEIHPGLAPETQLLRQAHQHYQAMMDRMLALTDTVTSALVQQNAQLGARIVDLEQARIDHFEEREALLSKESERQATVVAAERGEQRLDKILEEIAPGFRVAFDGFATWLRAKAAVASGGAATDTAVDPIVERVSAFRDRLARDGQLVREMMKIFDDRQRAILVGVSKANDRDELVRLLRALDGSLTDRQIDALDQLLPPEVGKMLAEILHDVREQYSPPSAPDTEPPSSGAGAAAALRNGKAR